MTVRFDCHETRNQVYSPEWEARGREPAMLVSGEFDFLQNRAVRGCPNERNSPTCIKLTASFGLDAKLFSRIDSVYRDRCEQSLE